MSRRMPARGRLQPITGARLGLAVTLQERDPERLEEDADFGVERRAARNPGLDAGRRPLRAPSPKRQREDAIHRQVPRLEPALIFVAANLQRSARADISTGRRCASMPFMMRARSISNRRGTTTMIVGCTSSMFGGELLEALGVIDLRSERDREVLTAAMLVARGLPAGRTGRPRRPSRSRTR